MASVDELLGRIDAEFSAMKERVEQHRGQYVEEYKARQERMELFAKQCERLRGVWRPRLEALAK